MTKKLQPVVKGPQETLALESSAFVPSKRKAAARALAQRERGQARIRYSKPPTKKKGNPFVAVRVPKHLLVAFKSWCKEKKTNANEALRAYMSRVTGVRVEVES